MSYPDNNIQPVKIREYRNFVLQCIDEEEEFPGEMLDDLWDIIEKAVLNKDKEFVANVLRSSVVLTKNGIRERIKSVDYIL